VVLVIAGEIAAGVSVLVVALVFAVLVRLDILNKVGAATRIRITIHLRLSKLGVEYGFQRFWTNV
jgi:hypothetical protein